MGFRKLQGFDKKVRTEQRKTVRYPVEADVQIVCGAFIRNDKTVDISAGGLSIKQNLPEELIGQSLDVIVTYQSSDGTLIKADGKFRMVLKTFNRIEIYDPRQGLQLFLEKIWG